jgi:hypothetical protein
MRRYGVSFSASVSASANTVTQAIGLITGSGRVAQIYEIIVAANSSASDATIRTDLFAVSALTAGTSLTPVALEQGNSAPAANTGASSTPTAVTTSGLSLVPLVFNSRATIRWAAVDPDSRVIVPAGGGAAGSLVHQNQQPGTVASLTVLHQLYFAE